MAERAEEDFLRVERQEHRIDAVDLHSAVRQWAGAIVVAHRDGEIQFGHEFALDIGCGWTLRDGAAHSSAQSTPLRAALSSGVTSITRARPVIFTSVLQFAMQGCGFLKDFSAVSRSSS